MAKIAIDMKSGEVVQDDDFIIGIDLGTTNSLVAYVKDGQPTAVRGADGERTLMPSVVYFSENGTVEVGDLAKEKLISEPQNTVFSVKRLMGKSYGDLAEMKGALGYQIIENDTDALVKIRVRDKFFNPIELSALILESLKKRIESALGKPVSKAVITVPAYFNDSQRQATRDAGRMAGLDVLRIVNEPTAASLAYGIGLDRDKTETTAVYDLGGGTFDISILQIEDGIFEVLATNGDTFLGGDDFDRVLMEHWMVQLGISKEKLSKNANLAQEIRLAAEEAKKSLSVAERFEGKINGQHVAIDRLDFEGLIAPFIQKTITACQNALQDAQLTISDIDKVVLVGGSTRVPAVRAAVEGFFKKETVEGVNPDEVVALGAAIQADILAGNQKDLLLLDVTPLSLGIETVGGLMDVIIPRNNKVPSKAGRQYTTSVDGQKNLKVAVYQGERDLVADNRKLGEFILKDIPPMPAGLPKIDIQFILNADGILTVRARELRSDVEQKIEIRPTYGISEEEMGKMLLESIQNAGKDMAVRALLEARNEADNILLSGAKFLQQNEGILTPEEIETTADLLSSLQNARDGEDKDQINQAMETLNTYTTPLAHRALDVNIGAALKGKMTL